MMIILVGSAFVGCAYHNPHESFLNIQRSWVGISVDEFNAINRGHQLNQQISDVDVGNGHRIAKYWYVNYKERKCMEVVEYDTVSRRILSMGFEGKPEHCIRNPV